MVEASKIVDALRKRNKADVDYSKGMLERHCGNCKNFIEPSSCSLVSGYIEPSYWCRLWEAK